jgi:beta-lactamase class D
MRSEFYVIDEKYFMCYKCVKEDKVSEKQRIRSYWKIPKNAQHTDDGKATKFHRFHYPWMHEDLWYNDHRKHRNEEGAFKDYVIYRKLLNEGIVILK